MKEIREGVREYIHQAQGYIEGCCPIDDITDSLIAYLHSQNCVIKVDRGLPQLRTIPVNAKETKEIKITIPEWWDDVSLVNYLGRIHQQDMLEAGYVATVPIIEESK